MDRREWLREKERLEARIDTLEGQLHAFLASDAIVHGGAVTDYGEAPRLQTDARAALTKMRMIAARRKVALRAARKRAQENEHAAMEAEAIVQGVRARLGADPKENTLDAVQWIVGELAAERAAHEQTRARLMLAAREAQAPAARGCVQDGDGYCGRHAEGTPGCESAPAVEPVIGTGPIEPLWAGVPEEGTDQGVPPKETLRRALKACEGEVSRQASAAEPSREEPEAIVACVCDGADFSADCNYHRKEREELEAVAAMRAWCDLDDEERHDAAAWTLVADAESTINAADRMLDAAPVVLRLYDEAIREREMFKRRSVERRETCTKLNARAEAAEARERAWFSAGKRALAESEARLAEDRSPRDRTLDELASECGHWRGLCSCKPSVVGHAPDPVADETPSVDPGEGWRLLGPDEVVCVGDEWWNGGASEWRTVSVAPLGTRAGDGFGPIRRRIADPVHAPTGDLPPARPKGEVLQAPASDVAAEEAELVRIVEHVAAAVYRRAESEHLYPDTVREYLVTWSRKDALNAHSLGEYLEADRQIEAFCRQRPTICVGARVGDVGEGNYRRIWPRTEDATPEATRVGDPVIACEPEQDDKGRWFIPKGAR